MVCIRLVRTFLNILFIIYLENSAFNRSTVTTGWYNDKKIFPYLWDLQVINKTEIILFWLSEENTVDCEVIPVLDDLSYVTTKSGSTFEALKFLKIRYLYN
jgi:hypothetical protein